MYNYPRWEELTIRDDYMFKLVMRRKRICKAMLEKILNIEINDIEYVEEEKTIQPDYPSHGIRLDVYVKDNQETVYNIEMQVRKPIGDSLARRTRYYQSMLDMSLFMAGQDYDQLNNSYIIFICPFDPIGSGRHIYEIRNYCTQDKDILFPDGATKVFLNTKGTMDDVKPDVLAFLNYVNGIVSNDELVQAIEHEINIVRSTADERVRYMTFLMKMNEERKAGREEGIAEGREEGREEGKLSNLLDNVQALMKNMNLSAEQALKVLNVSEVDKKIVLAGL